MSHCDGLFHSAAEPQSKHLGPFSAASHPFQCHRLGAQQRDVLRLVIGQGMPSVLIGIAMGIAAALAFSQLLASFPYGISDQDPFTFVGVSVLLTPIAFATFPRDGGCASIQ